MVNTLKVYVLIWVLAVLLLGSLYFNFNQASENKSLKKGIEVLNNYAEQTKQRNLRLIDSLAKQSYILDSVVLKKEREKDILVSRIQKLTEKNKADEAIVNNVRNADSIKQLFSEYYR